MFGKQKFAVELGKMLNISDAKAEDIYDSFIEVIKNAAEEEPVRLAGIGIIRKNNIPAHEAMNPATLQRVAVPDRFNYRMSSPTQDVD